MLHGIIIFASFSLMSASGVMSLYNVMANEMPSMKSRRKKTSTLVAWMFWVGFLFMVGGLVTVKVMLK